MDINNTWIEPGIIIDPEDRMMRITSGNLDKRAQEAAAKFDPATNHFEYLVTYFGYEFEIHPYIHGGEEYLYDCYLRKFKCGISKRVNISAELELQPTLERIFNFVGNQSLHSICSQLGLHLYPVTPKHVVYPKWEIRDSMGVQNGVQGEIHELYQWVVLGQIPKKYRPEGAYK